MLFLLLIVLFHCFFVAVFFNVAPTDSQTEVTRHDEEEQLDTSLCRRSVRSREPSDKFLSRRQYPFGTPQVKTVIKTKTGT